MVGEEKRHQMMQNLFGDQSEEEDEEEEIESEHESNRQPDYPSDDGGVPPEFEGEGEVEGQGEVEIESDGAQEFDPVNEESEDEIDKGIRGVEADEHKEVSERHYSESDEKEDYDQHVVTSRRRNAVQSESERSDENHYVANEEDEVNLDMSPRRLPRDEREDQYLQSAPEIQDVFGDSDDEEEAQHGVQNQIEEDENRSPLDEDENFERDVRPDDMIPEEYALYDSEEEHAEVKTKEKPVGPPLELEIPLYPPPAEPEQMHMIKLSNIMGIDSKPFEPNSYVEEDFYVTEESGAKKRIRLENNVVRWRKVKQPNGTISIESNARFVEWSDGSLQLLIGNEVLDISKQDAQHEQAHLFLRHGKGILQSQGRILSKMRFMPSSLASNSHRLLTAIVDSRHKKVYRVKNCITDIDPEREKEQREKAANQSIKANELLSRKKEKVSRKYTQPTIRRERQLSPGFLEDALEEDEDEDYYEPRRSRRRFEEDLEMEARAEKRIMNAKKGSKDISRRSSAMAGSKSSRRPTEFSESEREEESEYETEGEEEEDEGVDEEAHKQYAEEEEEELERGEEEEEVEAYDDSEEEAEQPKPKVKDSGGGRLKRKGMESDEDDSPQKASNHRRKKMVYDSDDDE